MYIFFDLSLFASLPFEQKHPLPVLSSVFSPKLSKKIRTSGMVGDFQFSKRALQKFKNSFLKRPKKGDFFSYKKVSIQKSSHQNYDVIK